MKVVIIIGAGSTLAEALPRKPARKYLPPLDTTFFELCRISRLPGRKQIQTYMTYNYGINPFSGNYRMEEVFNYIYSDVFSSKPPKDCLKAYWSLVSMYVMAIGRTTNRLSGVSRYGISRLLRHIYNNYTKSDITFITFNQDIMIEKAIEYTASTKYYSTIPWDITETYGLDFETWFHVPKNAFMRGNGSSIKIIKLHGSINWVYRVRSGSDPRNSLRNPRGKLNCINSKLLYTSLIFKPHKRSIDLIPLIIPPIIEKTSRYKRTIGDLWQIASSTIKSANKLIVYGYSFPETDFSARSLFKRSIFTNTQLDEIIVIDTDPKIASKIFSIGSINRAHYYTSVKYYVKNS